MAVSFLLLAAVLIVTQNAPGNGTGVSALGKSSTSMRVAGHGTSGQPATLPVLGEAGRAHRASVVKASLVSPGWCRQGRAVVDQLVPG